MEKLIHILPNLINNQDSDWLKNLVKNPDELTQDIMRFFNDKVYILSVINRSQYDLNILGDEVDDSTSAEKLIDIISTKTPEGTAISYLLEELNDRLDCKGKSATAVVWAAAILNNLENKNVNQNDIKNVFYAIASTLRHSDKNVETLFDELKELVSSDEKFKETTDTYVSYAFLLNSKVQSSSDWYDFSNLDKLDMTPNVIIKNNDDLISSLKDYRNYLSAIEYIKDKYLNETEPTKDGYCNSEEEKNYKAFIIVATLASETFKDDPNFDKDNTIGLNLTADILNVQEKINESHILVGISNKLNGVEEQAGKIASLILGRELFLDKEGRKLPPALELNKFKPGHSLFKDSFRTGSAEDYIKNHLDSFEKLIAPNLEYCLDLIKTLNSLENKYKDKGYKFSQPVEDTLNFVAGELGCSVYSPTYADSSSTVSPKDLLMVNIDMLKKAAFSRYDQINRLSNIYNKVRANQKINLDIEDLKFDKDLLGKDEVVTTHLHERIIKEFYKQARKDYILKSSMTSKLRLKSHKMILAEIKGRVNEEAYPELTRLLKNFKLSPTEQINEIVDNRFVNVDGSVNEEYAEAYKSLTNAKAEDRAKAVESSNLPDSDKEAINNLI